MSRESVLVRARAFAESGMRDTCTVTRITAAPEDTDPDTGVQAPTTQTIYEGPCRMQQPPAIARPLTVGGAQIYQLPLDLQLPMVGSEGIAVGDVVTITASVDVDLVGRSWWVRALFHKTDASARRLGIEEVTS